MLRHLPGRAVGAAFLASLTAAPAQAAEPTMALADVQPGMRCTALSVVQGTEPVSFDATVLGVDGGPRPSDALIIMRFSGAAVDAYGIGQGFSGSPVSCPDGAGTPRVVGAISQGIGQYDNLVAGVTPIEAMLATPTRGTAPLAPAIGQASSPGKAAKPASASSAASRPARRAAVAAPWGTGRTPLTLTGVRGALGARLARVATARGLPMSVGALATRAATPPARPGLRGGDAVAVSTVTGDVSAGAIGTVTYVDGDRIWAFGHPFNGSGASRLLMQQASITTIIGSPNIADQVTYKLGTPGAPVGTIGFDGSFAIGGVLGGLPPTIPTDVTVRNAAGAVVQTGAAQIVDEREIRGGGTPALLPLAAAANAGAALQRLTSQTAVGGSARVCTTISLKGQAVPLYQCADSVVTSPDVSVGGVETGVAEGVASAVAPATSAERFLNLITSVKVDVRLRDEADTAQIVRIRRPKVVRAGRLATIRVVVVQGSTGERREIPVKVRIPKYGAGMKTGIAVLADPVEAFSDASLGDVLFGSDDSDAPPPPKNLAALRALYTGAGISGLRVIAVPGFDGEELLGALSGQDSGLDDADLTALAKAVRIGQELPTVQVAGSAAINVRPTR